MAEPALAVDPARPDRVAAAWMQDDNTGIVAAASSDGGQTWARSVVPFGLCSGGDTTVRVVDPRLVYARNGTLVASSVGGVPDARAPVSVSRSADGGRSWAAPSVVSGPTAPHDYDTMAVGPDGTINLLYSSRAPDMLWLTRSHDNGASWSAPSLVARSAPGDFTVAHLAVASDSTLLVVQERVVPVSPPVGSAPRPIEVLRSTDGGGTWRLAAELAQDAAAHVAVATDRDRGVDVTFTENAGTSAARVVVAHSSDSGATWGAPRPVKGLPLGTGSVTALARDAQGRLGLLVDLPTATGMGDRAVWFGWTSPGASQTWHVRRLSAPWTADSFVGDYQSLVGTSRGFVAAYVVPTPESTNEVRVSTIRFP